MRSRTGGRGIVATSETLSRRRETLAKPCNQAACASLQLRPDIGKPDAANHAKLGTQLRGRAAWMRFQKILDILSDDRRQMFDLEGDHIQKTHARAFWISKLCESEADDESTMTFHRTNPAGLRAT